MDAPGALRGRAATGPGRPGPNLLDALRWASGGWTVLVFGFLYLPILLLVVYSFNASRLNVRWTGFTVDWYRRLFENTEILAAFQNSLVIALATTAVATLLGTLGAWLLHRYRFPFVATIGLLIFVPMVVPEVLMGVSLRMLFATLNGWIGHPEFGHVTVAIAHVTFCFPFVVLAVQARLDGIDPHLEEAAQDLGAPPVRAFLLVIVPYLMPAIVSGALMTFTLSMDEYIVTLFTTSAESQTLPIKVYGMVRKGLNPQLNALSTLFIVATFLLVVLSDWFARAGARRR